MTSKLLSGTIILLSVFELNCKDCCSSCKSDKTNEGDKKNHKPNINNGENPKPITTTIPESESEPEVKPIDFNSIKIAYKDKKNGSITEWRDVTSRKITFSGVIDDKNVYDSSSARIFRDPYSIYNYMLVFKENVKDNINIAHLDKVLPLPDKIYCLSAMDMWVGIFNTTLYTKCKLIQDPSNPNLFIVNTAAE